MYLLRYISLLNVVDFRELPGHAFCSGKFFEWLKYWVQHLWQKTLSDQTGLTNMATLLPPDSPVLVWQVTFAHTRDWRCHDCIIVVILTLYQCVDKNIIHTKSSSSFKDILLKQYFAKGDIQAVF